MDIPTNITKIDGIEVIQLGQSTLSTENKSQENKKVGRKKPKKKNKKIRVKAKPKTKIKKDDTSYDIEEVVELKNEDNKAYANQQKNGNRFKNILSGFGH